MPNERQVPVPIEEEMRKSYLDYAMSVIVGRALPDIRDGLKPVHRRVLYTMHELGLNWNRAYKKSARVVGEVLGKYHPHGDAPVYEALVRMVQEFSLRYPLVDGQGNFGSIDGDPPAAMRYTETRLAMIAPELPYQVNKATLIEKIGELIRDKKIEGISERRDESSREGIRIVLELGRGEMAQIVINQLYKHTPMQTTFGVIMLALVGRRPQVVNLKQMLQEFIAFRREVVTRRTQYDLARAEERAHILEGLRKALDQLDLVIRLIRQADNPDTAKD